jgi:hypothetical protein
MGSLLIFDWRARVRENCTVDALQELAGLGRGEQSFAEGVCYSLAGHLGSLVGRKSVQDQSA